MRLHYLLFIFIMMVSSFKSFGFNKPEVHSMIQSAEKLMKRDTEKSLLLASQALGISRKEKYVKEEIIALITMSNIFWYKTELGKALDYAETALTLAESNNFELQRIDAYLSLGRIYQLLGDFDLSADYFFKALSLSEKEKDTKRMSSTLSGLGFNYFDLGSYEEALIYYNRSLELSRQLNDSLSISRELNNIAAAYASLGIFSDFENVIKEAISINSKSNNKSWLGVNYLNLGSLNGENNNFDTAFYYFNKAEDLFIELNQLEKVVKIYIEKAKCYQTLNNPTQRLYYLNKSLDLATHQNLKRMSYLSALELHDYFLEQHDTAKAYQYLKAETKYKDSLDIKGNLTRLNHLEILKNNESKKHELAVQKQKDRFINQIIIIVLIATILVIFLLFRRYQLKVKYAHLQESKLKEELDFKNRELATNVLNLMKRNETLSEVSSELKELRKIITPVQTKKNIQQLSSKIDRVMKNNIWSDFEKRFNQVHPTFYDNLYEKFPDLTPNEKRICAFLKLNMSSKEISELTGQKVESLEKARTRLRKKLKLTNTSVNLTSYLSQF